MLNRFDPFLQTWRWPAMALAAALAMLGTAHAFEQFALMLPCELCLRQREIYWAVAAMSLTAVILWRIRQNPRFMLAINVMLGLVFLTGAVIAAYHAGVEWKFWPAPSGCAAGAIDISAIDFKDLDQRQATVSCTEAPWAMLGLSMAGWNTLVSFALALISFRAAGLSMSGPQRLKPAE